MISLMDKVICKLRKVTRVELQVLNITKSRR